MLHVKKATRKTLNEAVYIVTAGAISLVLIYVVLFTLFYMRQGIKLLTFVNIIGNVTAAPLIIMVITGTIVLAIFGRFEKYWIYCIPLFVTIFLYIFYFFNRSESHHLDSQRDWLLFFFNGYVVLLVLFPMAVWAVVWRASVNLIGERKTKSLERKVV